MSFIPVDSEFDAEPAQPISRHFKETGSIDNEIDRRVAVTAMLGSLLPLSSSAGAGTQTASRSDPALLARLANAVIDTGPILHDGILWQYVRGDLANQVNGINIVASQRSSDAQGAWVRLDDRLLITHRSDSAALANPLAQLTDALPRRPEEFGAVGDGVHDDAPAIQQALDAVQSASLAHQDGFTRPGVVMLTQGKRYRCNSTLTLDRRFHTLLGYATLDFSSWSGVYVRVGGTNTEFGNANGFNGAIEGTILIVGSGGGGSVGILYDSPLKASATAIRTVGITVCRCEVAFRFASRGYNQELVNCKAFECNVVFDWIIADDNDERITVLGGTFFNSDLFLRHRRGAGGFYCFGASIDYTRAIARIDGGKVHFFGVHLESNRWDDRPIDVQGDGGLLTMTGGWLLPMGKSATLTHLIGAGAGSAVKLRDVITHNGNSLQTPDTRTPTTWATGEGRFEMQGTEPAFEYGGFPARLHDRHSVLADPGFDEADVQLNPIWRIADVNPIRSRDGSDAPGTGNTGHNMRFARVTQGQMEGTGCLRIDKAYGPGSPSAMTIIAIPVRYGDKARGGLRVRTAPDRPGLSRRVAVRGGFAILDGMDQYGVPVLRKFVTPGDLILEPPTKDYVLAAPGNGAGDFKAPGWATHYLIQVDLHLADQASFLIDGRWADRW